jgi:hypothetical protein
MNDVRDEALAALLDRAAPARIPAVPHDRLERILRRGSRRRAARTSAIGAGIAVFVGLLAWVGVWLRPSDDPVVPADTGRSIESVRTLHDAEDGFSVSVPDGWVVADENLTPWLMSPSEILSVGTFPLRVSQDPRHGLRLFDAPVAPQALADMTADDVFLSLQGGGEGAGFGPRPEHFAPGPCQEAVTGCEPLPDIPFRAWWFPFRDAGRGFYLFVAIGSDATPELRDQIWEVANSLVFEPNDP